MLKDTEEIRYNETFIPRTCQHCSETVTPIKRRGDPHDLHGHRMDCPACGKFMGWGGRKKEATINGNRQFSTQWPPSRLGIDHCQMCERKAHHLGEGKLNSHHVVEIAKGGEDEPDNIWVVCTSCHRLIHHQRTYINQHVASHIEALEALERFKAASPELYRRVRGETGGAS